MYRNAHRNADFSRFVFETTVICIFIVFIKMFHYWLFKGCEFQKATYLQNQIVSFFRYNYLKKLKLWSLGVMKTFISMLLKDSTVNLVVCAIR